jgi:MFS transporter, ACS family, tartrate transporter
MPSSDVEVRVIRKVTWRLLPLLYVSFLVAFLDRVNVGFAKETMERDLGLSSTVYGLGAGLFFLGYFLCEVPSNLMLARVGGRIWIARIMLAWGAVSIATMLVRDATSFYLARLLLGASEAGFFPGVILYLTTFVPAAHRARLVALFMTAAVLASVIGSPLSGLLLELDGSLGLRGWQWLFLVEGMPAVVLGLGVLRWLPNGPRQARWLDAAELAWLEARLASERLETQAQQPMSLLATLAHPRVLALSAIYATNVVGGYGLDFFMPTLVHEALPGASAARVGALNAVPALVGVVVMVLHGRSSDRRAERRWHFATAAFWAAAGLVLASLRIPPAIALAALALAVSGRWSAIAPFWGLSTAFVSGRAAAAAIAVINSVGNLGGFAGPYLMGYLKDLTGDYALGLRLLGGAMFVGGVGALGLKSTRRSTG